jgi:putative flippase GtrA
MAFQKSVERLYALFSYRIVRYGLIGGISTLIHIGMAALFIYAIYDSLFWANVTGFLLAYVFSYLMQSLYVFGHEIAPLKAFKYFIVQFGSLMTSILISYLFTGYNNYIKTILVVIFMPIVTFVIHKFWTFKELDEEDA